jgi:hypothetical protein
MDELWGGSGPPGPPPYLRHGYEATNDGRDFHKNLKYRMAMKIGVTFLDIGKRCRRSREKFEDQKNIFN